MTGAPVPNSLRLVLIFFFGSVFLAALHLGHLPDPKPMALAMGGAFALALLRLRHVALALATVIAPLPGILLFGPSAYALSLAASLLMAANYADARLQDQNGLAALFRPVPALVITVIFAFGWALHAPVRQESLTAASLCVIFFLPGFALASGFNENAIARGNRFREIQLRFFSLAAGMAQPRWCIALSGAGLVLAVLGYFQIQTRPGLIDWLAPACIAAFVVVLTRDSRQAIAALAASALLLLYTGAVNGALLLFLFFALVLGRAANAWRSKGEDQQMAWMRALEDHGATILFAGCAAMLAAAARGGMIAASHAAAGLMALVLFPAITGMLQYIFPQRRRVEDLYRV